MTEATTTLTRAAILTRQNPNPICTIRITVVIHEHVARYLVLH